LIGGLVVKEKMEVATNHVLQNIVSNANENLFASSNHICSKERKILQS